MNNFEIPDKSFDIFEFFPGEGFGQGRELTKVWNCLNLLLNKNKTEQQLVKLDLILEGSYSVVDWLFEATKEAIER